MAGYLLDSGVLIRHLRGQREAVRLVRGLAPMGRLHISVITRLEIRFVHLLRERGQMVDIADVLIAATAVHHQLTLVTFNPKHFRLPGLSLYPLPE